MQSVIESNIQCEVCCNKRAMYKTSGDIPVCRTCAPKVGIANINIITDLIYEKIKEDTSLTVCIFLSKEENSAVITDESGKMFKVSITEF